MNRVILLLALAAPAVAADPFVICQQRAEAARDAIITGKAVLTREQSFQTKVALSAAVSSDPADVDTAVRIILANCLAEENPQ